MARTGAISSKNGNSADSNPTKESTLSLLIKESNREKKFLKKIIAKKGDCGDIACSHYCPLFENDCDKARLTAGLWQEWLDWRYKTALTLWFELGGTKAELFEVLI